MLVSYIKRHWEGSLSLATSFWINLVLFSVLWHILGATVSGIYFPIRPDRLAFYSSVHLFFQAPLLIWQQVGVWRCTKRKYQADKMNFRVWFVRASAIVFVLAGLVRFVHFPYQDNRLLAGLFLGIYSDPFSEYELEILGNRTVVSLSGDLGFGISDRLQALIEQNPSIDSITLDSPGGWVFEGISLNELIQRSALDTYVFNECSSSCALAFIAGEERHVLSGARLGFHTYRSVTSTSRFDLDYHKQAASVRFLQQGVSRDFVERMFEADPDSMWYPDQSELSAAGVAKQKSNCGSLPDDLQALCERSSAGGNLQFD